MNVHRASLHYHASEKLTTEKLNFEFSELRILYDMFASVQGMTLHFLKNLQVEPVVQRGNELIVHHILLYQCIYNVTVSAKH